MPKASERRAARLAAVQALYQMEVAGKGVTDAMAEFEAYWIGREVEGIAFEQAENAFFREILGGVVREQVAVDGTVDRALAAGWPLTRIEAVLRAILRCGVFELMFRKDVPARASITEYVDVTHSFYEGEEPGLVNGVLDSVARQLRPSEVRTKPQRAGAKPAAR